METTWKLAHRRCWWSCAQVLLPCRSRALLGGPYSRSLGTWAESVAGHARSIAKRLEALDALDWSRVEVVNGDVRSVEPIRGSSLYFDPPYAGCPRYACILPRVDVLEIAARHAAGGSRVLVSEGAPLPIPGWHACRLATNDRHERQRDEWLTASFPFTLPEQLGLFAAA